MQEESEMRSAISFVCNEIKTLLLEKTAHMAIQPQILSGFFQKLTPLNRLT